MNKLTSYGKNLLVDLSVGTRTSGPTRVYAAAYTSATSEVKATEYKRVQVTFDRAAISDGVAKAASNITIEFPTANTVWGTITHIAIYDSATGGNMLYIGKVPSPRQVEVKDTLRILKGDIEIEMD